MVNVSIADALDCPRYSATVLENVSAGTAPRWLRSRLQNAGMRSINVVVDATNYVMLETGQPLHAFDYDVLVTRAGGDAPSLHVRSATPGETLLTLDGVERKLTANHLVIADTLGAIALAGVMGGRETEVSAATKTVLLEAATFNAVSVRKTARQFNLHSEASTRYSKGLSAELVPNAALRACELLQAHAGATVVGLAETYPKPQPVQTVELNRSEIERVLGVGLPDGAVERLLTALEFRLENTPWGWTITVPTHRLDIQAGAADIIEELARLNGYGDLPGRLLPQELPALVGNAALEFEQKLQDILAVAGLSEALTYSLSSAELESRLRPSDRPVSLLNPLSPERSILRTMLLPGLLEVAARNLQSGERVAMFELGPVFHVVPGLLPEEPRRLAIVLCGRRTASAWDDPHTVKPNQYDFFDGKAALDAVFQGLNIGGVRCTAAGDVPYLHPGRAAVLSVNGLSLGHLGELHPQVARAFELEGRAVIAAELDLEALFSAVPGRVAYHPFGTLPVAKRDMAVIVPEAVTADAILAEIRTAGGELLGDAVLFDVYRGESIPPGTKSLAYALSYQAKDKTLTDKELDKAQQKIEGRLKHLLQATIRGK